MTQHFQVLLFLILPPFIFGCTSSGRIANTLVPSGPDSQWAEDPRSVLRRGRADRDKDDDTNLYVIDSQYGHINQRQSSLPSATELATRRDVDPPKEDAQGLCRQSLQRQETAIGPAPDFNPSQISLMDDPASDNLPGMRQELHTIEDFESWALSSNPVVLQLKAKLQSLQGKLIQVGLRPNPVVGMNGQDINENGGAGMYGVYFGRELVRGNKLQISRSVVCAEIKVAQQHLNEMKQRLTTDIRVAFYDLLVAQKKLELANLLAGIAQTASDTSEKLFEAKEVARSAVLQAQMESQNAIVIQGQAVNEEVAARRNLSALVGEPDLAQHRIEGDLQQISQLADFEQTYDQLLMESPELAKLFENTQRARRQLQRECVEPISNVTWQATVQYDTVGETIVSGFQVGFPIPKYNQNQGAIRQAEHEIAVAEFQVEQKALELRQRLANAYGRYLQAKLQVDIYSEEILPQAKRTFELISEGYRQGEVDFVSFLTAQRTYFDANLAYVSGLKQLWREHNLIQGLLLSASLSQDN
jgi:cobalt-zinc-cadmium efflux system outer membrane protein